MDCPKRKSKEDKVIQEVSLWLPGEDSLLRLCFLIYLSPTNDILYGIQSLFQESMVWFSLCYYL